MQALSKAILKVNNDFELTTPEEMDEDEAYQLEAFNNGLTNIHPYSERYREIKALHQKR